jgi:hypothetical protein
MIGKYLDDLENRIDAKTEDLLFTQWKCFTDGECTDSLFSPQRRQCAPPSIAWPEICINDAIEDFEMMALQQFYGCSVALAEGNGALMAVRCNYGTGILPSLFGAELFIMDRETNTLPTTKSLVGGKEAIKALLDRGIPDVTHGLGGKVLEMGQRFVGMMQNYPKIRQYVHIYHPDTQGPMDICELLWGSSLFLALLDSPELVKALLDLITETYIRFMREWIKIVPASNGYTVHWSLLHKGHIMLRDDSAMNLSPKMFAEFIEPYDQKLLDEFSGGAIHFCGKGDHYIHRISEMQGVYAIQMTQPEYNDMETIFQYTVDQGIKLLDLPKHAVEQALSQGRNLHNNVHCW